MPTALSPLDIRNSLGPRDWSPPQPFGPDGWFFVHTTRRGSVIVSVDDFDDTGWIHASIAWRDRLPSYDEVKRLHRAVYGDGWAYQVFAPPADHVNIHEYTLHLFGRLDGSPALPDFTDGTGSI
jgi:hypothetical protein